MSEHQFAHKKLKNRFAFVKTDVSDGKLVFHIEEVQFDPATEENRPVSEATVGVHAFAGWQDGWEACQ